MIDELLSMDRAFQSTWNRYLEFLRDPNLAPARAAEFLDRLAAEPDGYLGYTGTDFLPIKTVWLLRLERTEEAADTWIQSCIYGAGKTDAPELRTLLEESPVVREANKHYLFVQKISFVRRYSWSPRLKCHSHSFRTQ